MPAEEGFAKAIQNFMIAADLNKSLPEYGMSFIGRTFWMDWDFQATYNQQMETLKQHPKYTDGLEAMAELFLVHGYWFQSEKYIKRAMDVDPLSANHYYTLAHINYYQKKFEEALKLVEKALYINPEFVLAYELKTLCLIWLNRRETFDQFVTSHENARIKTLFFEVINEGKDTFPPETLKSWENVAEDKSQMVPYELFILANTNHKSEALELLRKYIAQKRGQIINFRQDPSLKTLRQFDEFYQLHISDFTFQEEMEITKKESVEPKFRSPELDNQMQKLMDFIETEKPYLDAQLSLGSLAENLQLHPNKLSYLINETSMTIL